MRPSREKKFEYHSWIFGGEREKQKIYFSELRFD